MRGKRVVVISDLHCGHQVGLTPPNWQYHYDESEPETWNSKPAKTQRAVWSYYIDAINRLKPIDILIVNGDAVDGKGEKSGGTELITSDRRKQADMAVYAIKQAKAKKIVMTFGTPYHTGTGEDWEDSIASEVKAEKIGGHEWYDINGVKFDVKHKVSSSSVPHARMTPLAKEKLWNQVWHAEHELQPESDVIIRSHVHFHCFCGGPNWLAMSTPALQGFGSKFGARQCAGLVHVGLIKFDVTSKTDRPWEAYIANLPSQKVEAYKL
jgi:predicted MPP superfamily phosphohydrolase